MLTALQNRVRGLVRMRLSLVSKANSNMKIHFIASAIAAMLLFGSNFAYSQDREGFSINAGLGASVIRDEDGAETFRDEAFGWTIGFDYRFNENISLGMGLFSLGEGEDDFNGQLTTIEVAGFEFNGRLYLPVSEKADLFLVAGVVSYYTDINPGFSFDPFGSEAWEAGLGADFYTDENLAIRIEGRFFNGRRDESAGLLTIGFNYTF